MKIPLAWLQLSRETIRLLVALAGIGFADLLIFLQQGFQAALFESTTRFHQKLFADLILIHPQSEALHNLKSFSRRRLYQAPSFEEVESVTPMYLAPGYWKNPQNSRIRILFLFGFNPAKPILDIAEVNQNLDLLKLPNVVLFDAASRPEFGPIKTEFEQGKTVKTELNSHQVKVGGLFELGTSFSMDGSVLVSDSTFIDILPERNLDEIDLGLITLKAGTEPEAVKKKLEVQFGKEVQVFTPQEFIELEQEYWAKTTPIGFIFAVGSTMGLVVGAVIVYQILYADISDHLPEYATLKAMGYNDTYLLTVVFQEALILAIIGYLPGFGISLGLYSLIKAGTQLPMAMNLGRAMMVFVLTVLMCFCSGAIAVRRLNDADPADIF